MLIYKKNNNSSFFDIFFINDKYNKNIYGGIMNDLEEKINIKDMIYEVRGKQVMLDSDLAKLYKCKNGTKSINLAVHRNEGRFPTDFYFQPDHFRRSGGPRHFRRAVLRRGGH